MLICLQGHFWKPKMSELEDNEMADYVAVAIYLLKTIILKIRWEAVDNHTP